MRSILTLAVAGLISSAGFATTASAKSCRWYGNLYACKDTSGYSKLLKSIHDGQYGKSPDLVPIEVPNSGAFGPPPPKPVRHHHWFGTWRRFVAAHRH